MKVLLTIILLFSNALLFGQTYPDEKTLKNDWEQWQDKVPVSGNVRVGLMLEQEGENFNPSEFYVVIPETTMSNLCVELSSKDGRYSANINYNISNLKAGKHQFILPTKYKSELQQYSANEVVILSTLNNDCNHNPELYLLSGWLKIDKTQIISAFVNSTVPTSLIVIREDGTKMEYKCENLKFPKVAYNKKCQIPMKDYKVTTELVIKERQGRGSKTNFKFYKMALKPMDH